MDYKNFKVEDYIEKYVELILKESYSLSVSFGKSPPNRR